MRIPRTLHELDDLILRGDVGGRHLHLAEHCAALAEAVTPRDAVNKAELLVAAAEQYRLAGDLETSVSLCRQAVADGGHVRIDVRAHLVAALVALGEVREARSIVQAIWADRPRDPQLLLFVGEHLEMIGDLNAAATWFTRGVVCRQSGDSSFGKVLLLWARARARGELGFPPDEFDLLADELRSEYVRQQLGSEPQPRQRSACQCGSGRKYKRCCGAGARYTAVATDDGDQVFVDLIRA